VKRIDVIPAQHVDEGSPLAEIALTPDAQLQVTLARQALDSRRSPWKQPMRGWTAPGDTPGSTTAQAAVNDARQRLERLQTAIPPVDACCARRWQGSSSHCVRSRLGHRAQHSYRRYRQVRREPPAQISVEPADARAVKVARAWCSSPPMIATPIALRALCR